MCIDTFALRFSKHGDPVAKKIIFLMRKDFTTPQDCFFEGEVAHWEKAEWRKETWGVVSTPLELCLCPQQYDVYAQLAEECKEDFMSEVLDKRVENLLKNQLEG